MGKGYRIFFIRKRDYAGFSFLSHPGVFLLLESADIHLVEKPLNVYFKYPFPKTSHGTGSLLQQVTREAGRDSILNE